MYMTGTRFPWFLHPGDLVSFLDAIAVFGERQRMLFAGRGLQPDSSVVCAAVNGVGLESPTYAEACGFGRAVAAHPAHAQGTVSSDGNH